METGKGALLTKPLSPVRIVKQFNNSTTEAVEEQLKKKKTNKQTTKQTTKQIRMSQYLHNLHEVGEGAPRGPRLYVVLPAHRDALYLSIGLCGSSSSSSGMRYEFYRF